MEPLPWFHILICAQGNSSWLRGWRYGPLINKLCPWNKLSLSNLTQILRSFFQQVQKNIPNISVSSEYFISKGDKTYSTSTGSCHTYWAYFLGVWSLLWSDQREQVKPEMPSTLNYFYHQKSWPETMFPGHRNNL